MKYELKYGKGFLTLDLDNSANVTVVESKAVLPLKDPKAALRYALRNPIGCCALAEQVTPDMHIGIIFNDITRATPSSMMLPLILDELREIPDEQITLFDAVGTHRFNTESELRSMIGTDLVDRFRIVQNNCNDRETQTCIGRSSFGHEVWINNELAACDLIIMTGFIEPHFFAGFSGGGKAILPGMAGTESTYANHSAKMIADPNATWGITQGNPIWEDIQESAELAGKLFLVNVTMNVLHEITGVFCGDLRQAHAAGAAFMKSCAMQPVDGLFDVVITTNSGYPLDMNLYQSVKGMSAAAQIVKPGGLIIIAAECSDGIPNHGLFREILEAGPNAENIFYNILNSNVVIQDQWQVQILAQILMKAEVGVYSTLTDEQIRSCLMRPIHDIAAAIPVDARICVMPQGPLTIPYQK